MSESLEKQKKFAISILSPYATMLDRQSPEYTIGQLRESFLSQELACGIGDFTLGMRLLLENKYLRRLNDERLELTATGKKWFTSQSPH